MEVLNNVVTSIGNYNSIPISITSNTSVVNLVDELTLIKDVDKKNYCLAIITNDHNVCKLIKNSDLKQDCLSNF